MKTELFDPRPPLSCDPILGSKILHLTCGLFGLVLHPDLDRLLEGDLLFENFSYDIRKSAMTSL